MLVDLVLVLGGRASSTRYSKRLVSDLPLRANTTNDVLRSELAVATDATDSPSLQSACFLQPRLLVCVHLVTSNYANMRPNDGRVEQRPYLILFANVAVLTDTVDSVVASRARVNTVLVERVQKLGGGARSAASWCCLAVCALGVASLALTPSTIVAKGAVGRADASLKVCASYS